MKPETRIVRFEEANNKTIYISEFKDYFGQWCRIPYSRINEGNTIDEKESALKMAKEQIDNFLKQEAERKGKMTYIQYP